MIQDKANNAIRKWGLVGVSAGAVVLVAAAADPDRSWARIRAMPREQRAKLLQNLQRFDLELTPEKQQAIRDLDRRIGQLDRAQQFQYRAVLRRYHNWVTSLPDNRRDELIHLPPAERMALVRKLIGEHPVTKLETPQVLRIAEVGEYSPFELAAIFKIWQTASPAAIEKVERQLPAPRRREAMFRLGDGLGIAREIKPPNYDEEKWIALVEQRLWKARPVFKVDDLVKKKQETIRKEILHRQAINLYTVETGVRSVDRERLDQFAGSLPTWVQTTLDHYPADELRRRLSFAYRLVFPYPEEIRAKSQQRSAPPAKVPSGAGPTSRPPGADERKSDSTTPAPF
jgi:hypothetical protein